MSTNKLTPAMLRELRTIDATGEPTDLIDWLAASVLWFHARDRVLAALVRRDLIDATENGFVLTEAGRAAIAAEAGAPA